MIISMKWWQEIDVCGFCDGLWRAVMCDVLSMPVVYWLIPVLQLWSLWYLIWWTIITTVCKLVCGWWSHVTTMIILSPCMQLLSLYYIISCNFVCTTLPCCVTVCVLRRLLVTKARKIAQQYHLRFKELIPVSELVQRVASVMQEYTQSGWVL